MQPLIGGALGLAAGVGVWQLACRYVNPTPDGQDEPGHRRGTSCALRGILSPPAAGIVVGLTVWGAYAGWRAAGLAQLLPSLVVTALLLAISWADLAVRRIPNPLLLALLAWAVIQAVWLGEPTAGDAALGLLVGGGIFLALALLRRGAMGAGDVKLAAVLGAIAGLSLVVPALLCGAVVGGIASLLLLLTRRIDRRDYIAYGPCLALGAWIVWTGSLGLWL